MDEHSLSNSEHALACGIVLGALMKANADDTLIKHVNPFYDSEQNYTNQMLVQIGDRHYTVTVDEAVAEATSTHDASSYAKG